MKRLLLLGSLLLLGVARPTHAQYSFTSLDFPGGTLTTARGINNQGEIVGAYRITPPRHALLIRSGNYIPLAPTSVLGTHFSEAWKTNDSGDVVGDFIGDDGFTHGFLLNSGGLTTLDFPGASDTIAFGINELGTVVGLWDILDSDGNLIAEHGFIWKNGVFSEVDFPGAADTSVMGINAAGDLVGSWDSGLTSPIAHGYVFSNGKFASFDVPIAGATVTQPDDINALGHVVGLYSDVNGILHGFLIAGASFATIDFPGSVQTTVWGINSAGQIVGDYFLISPSAPSHGFLANPGNTAKGLPASGTATGQSLQATPLLPSREIVGRNFRAHDD